MTKAVSGPASAMPVPHHRHAAQRHVRARPAKARAWAVAILLAMATGALADDEFRGAVARVTDGDTFRLSGVEPAIRVWGLDAPERGEGGGTAATETLRALVGGRRLSCRLIDVDRYRRLVAQCFLPDGRDIAAAMIASGTATEYCRYSRGFYGTC